MGTSGSGFFDNDDSGDWFDNIRAEIQNAISEFLRDPDGRYQDGIAAINVLVNLANQDMPAPIPMWNFSSFWEDIGHVVVSLQNHIDQINDMGWRTPESEYKYQQNCENLMREVQRLKIQLDDFEAEHQRRRAASPKRRRRKRTN